MTLSGNLFAIEIVDIKFNLKDMKNSKQEDCLEDKSSVGELSNSIKKIAKESMKDDKHRLQDTIIVYPEGTQVEGVTEMKTLGMNAKDSLVVSGDQLQNNGCAAGHDQGTMNNRWCHSALARTFQAILEKNGVSPVISSIAGGVFWAPKEFFYDMNPSSSDFVVTYKDKFGTKRTTFEITMFGDAVFEKYAGKGFAPLKKSTPFFTITRKLGPAPK